LPPGPNQAAATQVLAESLSRTEPARAAELALTLPAEQQTGTLLNIVDNWSVADPTAAAEWVARFPAGELKDQAEVRLVEQWAGQDPYTAAAWLTQQPAGRARDQASVSLARNLRDLDPPAAAAWIDAIQDPQSRLNAQQEQFSWWRTQDPEAAQTWLNRSTVPADVRAAWQDETVNLDAVIIEGTAHP
jgi:hypothetical protein